MPDAEILTASYIVRLNLVLSKEGVMFNHIGRRCGFSIYKLTNILFGSKFKTCNN